MLGTRGIPASYGGFETCVEEVATRLAARGHRVTVYCRRSHQQGDHDEFRGVKLVSLPTIRQKYLDTPVHTLLATAHALRGRYDIIMVFGVGNSPQAWLLRTLGKNVLLNVDGLDWRRDKWPSLAKRMLRLAEWLAGRAASAVITDSHNVQHYYWRRHGARLAYIPYGASPGEAGGSGALRTHDLTAGEYYLYVGRLEPENRVHDLIEASNRAKLDRPTVIVGDAPYADGYKARLHRQAGGNVRMLGALYGSDYWELNQHAYAYVFPVASDGSHPALIEAMACGNCVLARDTPDNRAVGGESILYFNTVEQLIEQMRCINDGPEIVKHLGDDARRRARTLFSWERVTDDYERLARQIASAGSAPSPTPTTSPAVDDRPLVDALAQLVFHNRIDEGKLADPDRFRYHAAIHGVGPLLGQRVEQGELTMSPEVDAWLIEQIEFNRQRLCHLKREMTTLLDAFDEAGIPILPLKGSALLLDRSRDLSWRPMADIDLLVPAGRRDEVEIAFAQAGYCRPASAGSGLSGLDWKHRDYVPLSAPRKRFNYWGEHQDHPLTIEAHERVLESHCGIYWDMSPAIWRDPTVHGGYQVPNEHAMTLHLATHASVSALDSKLRMIQIYDLQQMIRRSGLIGIDQTVQRFDPAHTARFVYPALSLAQRWGCADQEIERFIAECQAWLPTGMSSWIESASFEELAWPNHIRPASRSTPEIWARTTRERLRLTRSALLPLPRDLDALGYRGAGVRAILGWYPRYYLSSLKTLMSRDAGARKKAEERSFDSAALRSG